MSDFITGDFVNRNAQAHNSIVKATEQKNKLVKIGLGTMYVLMCVVALVVI